MLNNWTILTIVFLIFYVISVFYFFPTLSYEIYGGIPWSYSYNFTDITVKMNIQNFDNRTWVRTGDLILCTFNVTNLSNKTIVIYHNYSMISPIEKPLGSQEFRLSNRNYIEFTDNVFPSFEGPNQYSFVFQIKNSDSYRLEWMTNTIKWDTEISIFFNKYSQILSFVIGIPAIIVGIRNFKDIYQNNNKKNKTVDFDYYFDC
jgi:hypothetical protein